MRPTNIYLFTAAILFTFGSAALQFKKPIDAKYRGENFLALTPNGLYDSSGEAANNKDADNAICYSDSAIAVVDGESPQVGTAQLPSKYISWHVANEVFLANKQQFQTSQAGEDSTAILKALEATLKTSMVKGVNRYREKQQLAAAKLFSSLAMTIPDWTDIQKQFEETYKPLFEQHVALYKDFKTMKVGQTGQGVTGASLDAKSGPVADPTNPASILDFRRQPAGESLLKLTNLLSNHLNKLTTTQDDYLNGITNFKRKINTGVAVVVARIIQNIEGDKMGQKFVNFFKSDKDYLIRRATVAGYQYGRSFVALFRRSVFTENKAQKFVYKLESYSQYKFRDLLRVYPELARTTDPDLKKFTKFSFEAEEGDILLVADSSLVDNFSYSFIELLMNLGTYKLNQNPEWNPEGDADLISLLKEYVTKIGNKDTVKYAYKVITDNPNFKNVNDMIIKGQGIAGCEMKDFFPSIASKASIIANKVGWKNDCLLKIAKAKYAVDTKAEIVNSASDEFIPKFDPAIISKMFGVASRMIQDAMNNPPGGAAKPEAFLTYKQVIEWRDMKTIAAKDPTSNFLKMTMEEFEQKIANKEFVPVDGDMSLFINILIKDAPNATENNLVCTEIADKEANGLAPLLQKFYTKTTNSEIIEDVEDEYIDQQREVVMQDYDTTGGENNERRLV